MASKIPAQPDPGAQPTRSPEWQRGYAQQAEWLTGKTAAAARLALRNREGTQEADPFNAGATQATRDYIGHAS